MGMMRSHDDFDDFDYLDSDVCLYSMFGYIFSDISQMIMMMTDDLDDSDLHLCPMF